MAYVTGSTLSGSVKVVGSIRWNNVLRAFKVAVANPTPIVNRLAAAPFFWPYPTRDRYQIQNYPKPTIAHPKGVNGYSSGGGIEVPTFGQIFPSGR